ncbi:hypothetical protein HUG17_6583 [Dermatophagoides farinae]|uniref:Uncharacterized protein n=1 Tax=Dermatophagoides farinae TaxID=6954 RepID=A0A9D4P4T5_DERFA|nr:hypothetical protein HUG17_6583 [Dermatophagoides farinae]
MKPQLSISETTTTTTTTQLQQQQHRQSNQFYGSSSNGNHNNNNNNNNNNLVQASIIRKHRIVYVDSPSSSIDNSKSVTIQVPAQAIPLTLILRSSSSNLNVIPQHDGSNGGIYEETVSTDEPIRLIHTIRKPIYQEIYEYIKPYRYVKQQILPVQETISTIISRQPLNNNNNDDDQQQQQQQQQQRENQNNQILLYSSSSHHNHDDHHHQQQQQQQRTITMEPYEQQESKQQQQQQSTLWQIQMRNELGQQYWKAINNGLLINLYGIPVL